MKPTDVRGYWRCTAGTLTISLVSVTVPGAIREQKGSLTELLHL